MAVTSRDIEEQREALLAGDYISVRKLLAILDLAALQVARQDALAAEARRAAEAEEKKLREYASLEAEVAGKPLELDPKPWRYDLISDIPIEQRAREAEQVTGGFSFAPGPHYEQRRDLYA